MTILVKLVVILMVIIQNKGDTNSTEEDMNTSVVLSRRKRFLVFPEGSSVQLVFCNTFPLVSAIGDIILWGYTAALAYELPQDPYSPFNHKADPLHRRMDTKSILYTDEDGKIIYERPYHSFGGNGKECLLKTLCMVGQAQDYPQGEFLQEIIRAVFTVPQSKYKQEDDYREYDEAFTQTKPCDEVYPECETPLEDPGLPTLSY